MNSTEFFKNSKNMNFGITSKLKDKNINQAIGKEQKTHLAPESILNDLYGKEDDDKITEEQNEEDKDEIPNKNEKENKDNNNKEEKHQKKN